MRVVIVAGCAVVFDGATYADIEIAPSQRFPATRWG
jgi:hypothetical protein